MFPLGLLRLPDVKAINVKLLIFLTAAFAIGGTLKSCGVADRLFSLFVPVFPQTFSPAYAAVVLLTVVLLHTVMLLPSTVWSSKMCIRDRLDTVMAGHFANPPEIAELIGTNQVAAYALPLGVMLHLWRAIAGHKPAVLTHVGLGTFADPRVEGCKANQKTRAQGRDIVELVSLDGRDYLAYKTFPIDACFIRARCV